MQISPLRSTRSALDRSAPSEGVARALPRHVGQSSFTADAPGIAPTRGGLRTFDPQINRQVAGAQQALNFLDQLGAQLQTLKNAFSNKLAESGGEEGDGSLQEQVKRFTDLMRQRPAATSGSLDGRLALTAPGEARQQFRIRGLDVKSLVTGERENLSLSVGGQRPVSVLIDPEVAPRALIGRIDHALMPAGIRARRDAHGELSFSVAEADWPQVRDALMVKGAGQRFPTGQFNRVLTDAEPDAIRPETWATDNTNAIRRTLHEIVVAAEVVRRARALVADVLLEASRRFERTDATEEAKATSAFAERFREMTERPDFEVFSAIAPALIAISRHRVVALLSLG